MLATIKGRKVVRLGDNTREAGRFAAMAEAAASSVSGMTNFRATIGQGVADFPVGDYFSSGESGALRVYERTGTTPFYLHHPELDPITRPYLDTNVTLSANSDLKIATQKAAKAYTDALAASVPASAKTVVETGTFDLDLMANPETMAAIINRTGLTPQMLGAQAADSDHSSFINAANDRLITAGGGTLWLPYTTGGYKLGSSVICHKTGYQGSYLKIIGTAAKTKLIWLGTTGSAFTIGDGTNPVYYVDIADIYVSSSATRTAGMDFQLRKASSINLKGIRTDGSYHGYHGTDLNTCALDDCEFNLPIVNAGAATGITITSDPAGAGRTDNVLIKNSVVQAINAGSHGLVVNGRVNGVCTEWVRLLGCRRNLILDSTGTGSANIPAFCDFARLETDRALEISVVINKAFRTEFHGRCDISNTSGAADVPYPQGSADTTAMFIGVDAVDTKFSGGSIGNCRSQAVQVNGKNTKFIGTTLKDPGKDTGNSYAAVFLGATADGFNFSECTVEGEARATFAFEIHASAKNGTIRDTLYKGVVTGFSTGTGTNVDVSGQKLVTY